MILNINQPFVINGSTQIKIEKPKTITYIFTFKIKPMNIYLIETQHKGTTAIVQAYTLNIAKKLIYQNAFGYTSEKDFKENHGKLKSKIIGMTDFKTGKAFKEKIIFISN